MSVATGDLARLLEHPAIWRGTSIAQVQTIPSGFAALDEYLPGGGWPRSGLIEILVPRFGVGELTLLLPMLTSLTGRPSARWSVVVAPPLEPFAPSLAAHGVVLERLLIVRVRPAGHPTGARMRDVLWACEQSLGSGASDMVMAWGRSPRARDIRRLQLAGERGHALGVLFRPLRAARESSHASLRLAVEPSRQGMRATLLKSRGGKRGAVDITCNSGWI